MAEQLVGCWGAPKVARWDRNLAGHLVPTTVVVMVFSMVALLEKCSAGGKGKRMAVHWASTRAAGWAARTAGSLADYWAGQKASAKAAMMAH